MVQLRSLGTLPPRGNQSRQEDMLLMSRHRKLPTGEPNGSLWDFRWYDSLGEVEVAWESGISEPLKTRILHLRSTLWQISEICAPYQRNEITQQISRLCNGELEVHEWWLLK